VRRQSKIESWVHQSSRYREAFPYWRHILQMISSPQQLFHYCNNLFSVLALYWRTLGFANLVVLIAGSKVTAGQNLQVCLDSKYLRILQHIRSRYWQDFQYFLPRCRLQIATVDKFGGIMREQPAAGFAPASSKSYDFRGKHCQTCR
jgi:hypothetical protein